MTESAKIPVVNAETVRKLKLWCDNRYKRRMYIIYTWSRDCDCVEGDSLCAIPASRRELRKAQREFYRSLEGPGVFRIISAEDAAKFVPYTRDRVLEAFENGSYYSV